MNQHLKVRKRKVKVMNKVKVRKWMCRYIVIFVVMNALMFPVYGKLFDDNYVTVAEGIVTSKVVMGGNPYLIIDKKHHLVDLASYSNAEKGNEITLSKKERTPLQELILIISFVSMLISIVGLVGLFVAFICWLNDDDTNKSYFKYIGW